MKKLFITIASIMICSGAFCQAYFGGGFTSAKKVNAMVGYLSGNNDITFGITMPLNTVLKTTCFKLSAGRKINITNKEENNYSLTPSVGIVRSFKKELVDKIQDLKTVKTTSPYYGLELGKDSYHGRMFLSVNYVQVFYAELGMKIFFN